MPDPERVRYVRVVEQQKKKEDYGLLKALLIAGGAYCCYRIGRFAKKLEEMLDNYHDYHSTGGETPKQSSIKVSFGESK